MRKQRASERARLIDAGIRLAWNSLESHLPWTDGTLKSKSKDNAVDVRFHKQAVREYAALIVILSQLY